MHIKTHSCPTFFNAFVLFVYVFILIFFKVLFQIYSNRNQISVIYCLNFVQTESFFKNWVLSRSCQKDLITQDSVRISKTSRLLCSSVMYSHKKILSLETSAWPLFMLLKYFFASARPLRVHQKKNLVKSSELLVTYDIIARRITSTIRKELHD